MTGFESPERGQPSAEGPEQRQPSGEDREHGITPAGGDLEPGDFLEELEAVEEALSQRRGLRSKAWRYLTLRIPLIAALLYLSSNLDRFYFWVGVIFFAAVADLLLALRRERSLELRRDALLDRLEAQSGDAACGDDEHRVGL